MTKERSVIFTGPMVRAIRDGRKTQTRRVGKDQGHRPVAEDEGGWYWQTPIADNGVTFHDRVHVRCPYGVPGDRLWVRETWWTPPYISDRRLREGADTWPDIVYDADCNDADREQWREWGWEKKPSIHLRREHARIDLEITGVRVERVQEISTEDACAEGCLGEGNGSYCIDGMSSVQVRFMDLWNKLNRQRGFGWDVNPWVWVITFRLLRGD